MSERESDKKYSKTFPPVLVDYVCCIVSSPRPCFFLQFRPARVSQFQPWKYDGVHPRRRHDMHKEKLPRAALAIIEGGPLAPQISGKVFFYDAPQGTWVYA